MTKPGQDKTSKEETPRQVLEAINRAILESALDCIISMDATGVVREFNPAAERCLDTAAPKPSEKNWPS